MGILESVSQLFGKGKGDAASRADKSVLEPKIRQSDVFKDLPAQNFDEMFARMETIVARAGDVIIREGDEGDYYYLLVSGTIRVTRKLSGQTEPHVVAEISEPFGFGEEALISNAKRNATVTVLKPGTLMRLSKDAFNDYVKEPLVDWLSPVEAQARIAKGGRWVDVRETATGREAQLPGAVMAPLETIRERMATMERRDVYYVCYCETGRQSSTAAFLMRQRGFNVGVLRGGLRSLKNAGIA